MTLGGWINLLVSVGVVTLAFGWCVFRVLRVKRPPQDFHGVDIPTPDLKDDEA